MSEHQKFLLFLCGYLSAMKPEGVSGLMTIQPALKRARELGHIFDSDMLAQAHAEEGAWEYALWTFGFGKRPSWVPPG